MDSLRKDLNTLPIEGINGSASDEAIMDILARYGIIREKERTRVEIWGTGNPRREFMYSEDMAAACVYLMENVDIKQINSYTPDSVEAPRKIHFLNIGTGNEVTIRELAETIRSSLGFKGEIYFNTDKPDGTMRKLTNVDLLHNLGFRHDIELGKGLEMVYKAYLEKQV